MFSITNGCGRCGNLVDLKLKYAGRCHQVDPESKLIDVRKEARGPAVFSQSNRENGPLVSAYGLAFCPRCNGPALIEFHTHDRYLASIVDSLDSEHGLLGGQSLVKVTAVFPEASEPETDPAWPMELVRQFSDAQRMLDQGFTPSIIIGVCRSVLDIATRKLGSGELGGVLAKRIDLLLANGIITKPIADWAHTIRVDGNGAVHEGVGDLGDAREYVSFLRMFLNVAFTLPARIHEKKSATNNIS